jgi:ABC-type bacteriocin/lantibiotic exporter with double-glycine peptidase domain
MSAFAQLLTLALPLLVGLIVDRVVPRGDTRLLLVVCLGLCGMIAFHWLCSMVRGYLILNLRTTLEAKMTMSLLEQMMALPYAFFQMRYTGDLSVRLNSNATIREILTSGALSTVLDGSMMGVYALLLCFASPRIAGLVLLLCLLELSVVVLTRKKQREYHAAGLERRIRYENYQYEMLAGIETLKAMGCERRAQQRWSDLFVDVLNMSLSSGRLNILVDAVTAALRMGAPLAIFALGALQVLDGELSVGSMLAINTFAVGIFAALSNLVATAVQFDRLGTYFDRIADVHDAPREQDPRAVRRAERLSGAIELEQVHFRYGPLEREIVRGVSLKIEPGEFVALVGPSGSGKSTLAGLLLGLYVPTAGRVAYDGQSLTDLELASVREQLGIVTQQSHLFGTTIRANIALSDPELPFEEVVAAAKLAQVHDDIIQMPMAYATLLSGGGGSISGGQRQRLALARALVRKPAVLLLDEATSALDARTERSVHEALAGLCCTRVVIAHRLSTVRHADRILVMQQGQLVEQGSHDQLLARRGLYAELVAAQTHDVAGRGQGLHEGN